MYYLLNKRGLWLAIRRARAVRRQYGAGLRFTIYRAACGDAFYFIAWRGTDRVVSSADY